MVLTAGLYRVRPTVSKDGAGGEVKPAESPGGSGACTGGPRVYTYTHIEALITASVYTHIHNI